MKESDGVQRATREYDKLENFRVVLVDKRGRILWISNDPMGNEFGYVGKLVPDTVVERDRALVMESLSRCFVDAHMCEYIVEGDSGTHETENKKWRVTCLPVDSADLPKIAGVLVASSLPENYDEITDEEKDILKMLASDCTLKDIANELHRSESAIDTKIKNLKTKLNRKNLAGLVGAALSYSII